MNLVPAATDVDLTRCTDAGRWDRFVASSSHGSIFSTTSFLNALGFAYDLWLIEAGSGAGLGAVILKDAADQPLRAPFGFALYQGPMFGQAHTTAPIHRRAHDGVRVLSAFLAGLESHYDRISFAIHYEFPDIRPFSWFHHGETNGGFFETQVLYSGIVDLNQWPTFDEYLGSVRASRRYERKKALKAGLWIEESSDATLLVSLYRSTFARQGIDVPDETIDRLLRIADASFTGGFGETLVCRNSAGEPVSATLFLRDSRSAYYLVGANDPMHRTSGAGTLLMLENIKRCYSRGIPRVDVVGINSPRRGEFKTSFNARPVPYFLVTWERPAAA